MFLVVEDFNKFPYNVPAKQLATEDGSAFTDTFSSFVDREEAKILKRLLGIKLYDLFIAGLVPDYPAQIWLDLRDGAQYEFNGITYEWVGVVKLLLPFITSVWLGYTFDNWADTGVSVSKIENAEGISPTARLSILGAEFYGYQGGYHKADNSLFGFLYVNKAVDYPDWVFTETKPVNRFDL